MNILCRVGLHLWVVCQDTRKPYRWFVERCDWCCSVRELKGKSMPCSRPSERCTCAISPTTGRVFYDDQCPVHQPSEPESNG
jgi:hypothetical protein